MIILRGYLEINITSINMTDDTNNPLADTAFSPGAKFLWGAVPRGGSSPLLCTLFPYKSGAELIIKQYKEKIKNKKKIIQYELVKYKLVRTEGE